MKNMIYINSNKCKFGEVYMRIYQDIARIFEENSSYKNPTQAVNQASSLNALSGDLYTDANRFIYELLQNADDSLEKGNSVEVWMKIIGKELIFGHSGKPFDQRDLMGICNINNGTKKNDINKTGYKGIGFKSVFGQSDKVTIFSNNEYFRFDRNYDFIWQWEISREDWEKENGREFQYPWQIIPIYTKEDEVNPLVKEYISSTNINVATIISLHNLSEVEEAIKYLTKNTNMFLFLKNISKINFELSESTSILIDRSDEKKIKLANNNSNSEWIIKSNTLKVPESVRLILLEDRNIPEKLATATDIEVTLAAKIINNEIVKLNKEENLLYSYLPTGESKYEFPVLVNTSFLTAANRESLHVDSKWNQWIFNSLAVEIVRWIAELVESEFNCQSYQLIPKQIYKNELGNSFNCGIENALQTVKFVLSKDGDLITVKDAIVDTTFLSEKDFVGENAIKSYVCRTLNYEESLNKKFVINNPYSTYINDLCSFKFTWNEFSKFLLSSYFYKEHDVFKNIHLILHLKKLYDKKLKTFDDHFMKNLTFIWNHKHKLSYPSQVCIPTPDDTNWDNPESELMFLHEEIQKFLKDNPAIYIWLENLGVKEKTDVTYIRQNILPNIENISTLDNTHKLIIDLFSLYKKGVLDDALLNDLNKIRILTQNGSLIPVKESYLSNYYKPRVELEKVIRKDIFISESYCENKLEIDEWKRFFKKLGACEGISTLTYQDKLKKEILISKGIQEGFFTEDDKLFKPNYSTFRADEFENLISIEFLMDIINNLKAAAIFWQDLIDLYSPTDLTSPLVAYWGYSGRQGRIYGSEVGNYISWFIKNNSCLPTIMKKCFKSNEIFLNSEELLELCGEYLPIFQGPKLSDEWKMFFEFKTHLKLEDYLELLTRISIDTIDNNQVKEENIKRIQLIYNQLMDDCEFWNNDEIVLVGKWSEENCMLNSKKLFSDCNSLYYYWDGNESVFQEQYGFIYLSAENKQHRSLEMFLKYFKVSILRQSEFNLVHSETQSAISLKEHLFKILPYLKVWIENDESKELLNTPLSMLEVKTETLEIYEAEELKITYDELGFSKVVYTHFIDNMLYVKEPWNSNSVLLKLSGELVNYYDLRGHDKKIDFLLRSTIPEIEHYFEVEEYDITHIKSDDVEISRNSSENKLKSFAELESKIENNKMPPSFYHLSKSDYNALVYVESLVDRAVGNVLAFLTTLDEYDCTNSYRIAKSIIGGVLKNGNEIAVVARPSDGNKVLLYYTSEFDVLDYMDAELWCENGSVHSVRRITMGQLFKKTGMNKIPINTIKLISDDLDDLLNAKKSKTIDYSPVPYTPQILAQTIAAFNNTDGGKLIFGLREINSKENEVVGISKDFNLAEIIGESVKHLSKVPNIKYDWFNHHQKLLFVIEIEKNDDPIFIGKHKYVRVGNQNIIENSPAKIETILSKPYFENNVVLIISIENYFPRSDNQITPVKYANADAEKFKQVLINSMNVKEEDITIIKNEEAIKSNLEFGLKMLFNSLTEKDRLIFYYVGHGFHNGVTNYLSTYDMHSFNITETAIPLSKLLLDPLKKSKCNNALIFIDACAKTFKDENERSNISDINDDELVVYANENPNYSIFLSCLTGQSSYSSDNLMNGVWTYHLINALSGKEERAIVNRSYITDRSLSNYLTNSVSQYTEPGWKYNQIPRSIIESSHENIILEMDKIK